VSEQREEYQATSPLSAEERAELRRLEQAATPGPWEYDREGERRGPWLADLGGVRRIYPPAGVQIYGTDDRPDAEFIVAARTALPRLLDALERCEALVAYQRVRAGDTHTKAVMDLVLGDAEGVTVRFVLDRLDAEIEAIVERVAARAQQAVSHD
jgi:hypothetical protein